MTNSNERQPRLAKKVTASILMMTAVLAGLAGGAIAFGERSLPQALILLAPAFLLAKWSLQIWSSQGSLIKGSRREQLNLVLKVVFGLFLAVTGILYTPALLYARSIFALLSVASLVIGLSILKRAENERKRLQTSESNDL